MSNSIDKKKKVGYSIWDFWVIYILIILFYSFKYGNLSRFHWDGLNLNKIDAGEYFSLILTTVSSLLGILVAAFLLSFQLIGKEVKRRKETSVLHNPWVIQFVSLSFFFISMLIICYILIPKFESNGDIYVGYYFLLLFLIFFVQLFIVVNVLLKAPDGLNRTIDLIGRLNLNDYEEVEKRYNDGQWMNENNLKLSEIRDEILYAIRDNDNGALNTILNELTNKSNNLLGWSASATKRTSIIKAIIIIWKEAGATADSNQRVVYYEIVLQNIKSLYVAGAKNKIPLIYFKDLGIYYIELVEYLIKRGDLMTLKLAVETFGTSLLSQLGQNCPDESQLQFEKDDFLIRDNGDANIQWNRICSFFYLLGDIQILAIDNKYKKIFEAVNTEFYFIIKSITDNTIRLGEFQKRFLVVGMYDYTILSNTQRALNNGLYEDTSEALALDSKLIADIIINAPLAAKYVLSGLGTLLINARRNSQLNSWNTIKEFANIPIHTIAYFHTNKTVQHSTSYVFRILKKIKEEIDSPHETYQKKSHTLRIDSERSKMYQTDSRVYKEIKLQLNFLTEALKTNLNEQNETPLLKEIQQCLSEFKGLVHPSFNIVPWNYK